jgi:imidazolonepropionase
MKLFTEIAKLYQIRGQEEKIVHGRKMNALECIEGAYLLVEDGIIKGFGTMDELDAQAYAEAEQISLKGRSVLPTWVDSHTHLVFADWRNHEFLDRLNGLSYQEIAERGGGILNSAERMREADEDVLFEAAMVRLNKLIAKGTGAIEIKSGYGLSTETELKMLRVIRRIKAAAPIPVKATFLGPHAFPARYKDDPDAYIDEIINEMIPAVAAQGLADYVDAFCEQGYFNLEQTERILKAGLAHGLVPKVHVNQFNAFGAVELCVRYGARSVDHLEELNPEDIAVLQTSDTIAVGLPGCSFFLGIPYTPVKALMDADVPVALASDFNPGSAPDGNLNFAFSLACTQMKMSPNAAVNALTMNAAAAMDVVDELGSITVGKRANFIVTEAINDLSFLPYAFGDDGIASVYINGERFTG